MSIFSVIPELSRDASTKSTLDTIKALSDDEISIKTLLTNESLHQFRLLDPARFVTRGPPPTPSPQVDVTNAPVQAEDSTSTKSIAESPLVKCSETSIVEVPKKALLPSVVEEEGGSSRHADKAPIELESPTEEEQLNVDESNADQAASHEEDDAYIFDDLEGLSFTRKELFGELAMSSKLTAPVVEASQNIPPTPVTQMTTPVVPASITPLPQSGSWRVVHTLHTLRIFQFGAFSGILITCSYFFRFNREFLTFTFSFQILI